MNNKRGNRGKRVRNIAVSIAIGGLIAWFLLSKIEPRSVPRAINNIPLQSLVFAFLLYAASIFFKATRFKIILRSGISLKRLFPIISLYTFLVNILPMRTGDISYIYLLKKQEQTPGTKSVASLVIGAVADLALIMIGILIVGYHLGEVLTEGLAYFSSALNHTASGIWQTIQKNIFLLLLAIAILAAIFTGIVLFRRRDSKRQHPIWRYISAIKSKALAVWHELAETSFDIRLVGIIICSIFIMVFRFGAQCYLVNAMGIDIGIWELNFALLFGVLFSLLPIHGPAGLGTVEAPWVMILFILGVSKEDGITSGFSLHIIIIIYAIIMGIYGALSLKILQYVQNRNSVTG